MEVKSVEEGVSLKFSPKGAFWPSTGPVCVGTACGWEGRDVQPGKFADRRR